VRGEGVDKDKPETDALRQKEPQNRSDVKPFYVKTLFKPYKNPATISHQPLSQDEPT